MALPALTFHGRLPGVECSPALPAAPEPVRLDVAAFVGFAEQGPLDLPVPVEDVNQYAAVFGGDLVLASDGGRPVYAQLPGAVRSFFDNGGRRCYVVRVAGPAARAARWVVPGLRIWQPDGEVADAFVASAWAGGWSAGTEVGTQLVARPLAAVGDYRRAAAGQPGQLTLSRASDAGLRPGDLLRLDPGPLFPSLYLRVAGTSGRGALVSVDRELPYRPAPSTSDGTGEDLPDPAALALLPGGVPVAAAWVLRLDIVVRQRRGGVSTVVERLAGLSFGGWPDALQPVRESLPDQTRSGTLRADAGTAAALATGLAVPVGMAAAAVAEPDAGPADPPWAPGEDGTDDLDSFDPVAVFVDPNLAGDTVDSLLERAAQLTYLARDPVRLRGMHAVLDVDEVAVLAVPDLAQRGWSAPVPPPPPPPPAAPPTPPPVDWSAFRCCVVPVPVPPPAPPPVVPPPAAVPPDTPVLDDIAAYDESGLVAVQQAMVTLCAARADVVAVLSVPQHYTTPDVLDWQQRLAGSGPLTGSPGSGAAPLSYAGYWHPWLRVLEPATPRLAPLRSLPPDGAVAGLIAARELARGAWVAPANVPLRGPVDLVPVLREDDLTRLFDARANLLRQQPGSFTTLSAHTLAADPALLHLPVRRLLILLRKVALRAGQRYTFEVNNDRFRQLVRLRFERLLGSLRARGAFLDFRVVTDAGVNTPEDIAEGRLVVALQIAPSSPVEFITVTLVRSSEGLLDVLEG
jgi:uncharacterized protein